MNWEVEQIVSEIRRAEEEYDQYFGIQNDYHMSYHEIELLAYRIRETFRKQELSEQEKLKYIRTRYKQEAAQQLEYER